MAVATAAPKNAIDTAIVTLSLKVGWVFSYKAIEIKLKKNIYFLHTQSTLCPDLDLALGMS